MDNLEYVIGLLFKRVSPIMVLQGKISCDDFPKKDFIQLFRSYFDNYSDVELLNLYLYLCKDFFKKYYSAEEEDRDNGKLNVFQILKYYSKWVLTVQDNDIMCQYGKLLHWRMMTLKLSEDLLTTAYLAQRDIGQSETRKKFDWKISITHNNVELKKILARGICENHAHLNGTAPIFQLNWINFMNTLSSESIEEELSKLDDARRNTNVKYTSSYTEDKFSNQILQAAFIRFILVINILKKNNKPSLEKQLSIEIKCICMHQVQLITECCRNLTFIKKGVIRPKKYEELIEILLEYVEEIRSNSKRVLSMERFKALSAQLICNIERSINEFQDEIKTVKETKEQTDAVNCLSYLLGKLRKLSVISFVDDIGESPLFGISKNKIRFYLLHTGELRLIKEDIQRWIVVLKVMERDGNLVDYASIGIFKQSYDEGNSINVLEGERWFLYQMFLGIYKRDPDIMVWQDLFYIYLIIKENFRSELIQNNSSVGFENFRIYENRKDVFLEEKFFKNILVKEAVRSTLFESNALAIEARIGPKNTMEELIEKITKTDEAIDINKKYRERFFYVIHFIKTGMDQLPKDKWNIRCRHATLRASIRQQAQAIAMLRKERTEYAKRIRGIDAANIEIGCGPEVFAQVFRYLSDHIVDEEENNPLKVPQLKITYHVGEDFLDIISGLRSIDEAMNFLNMKCGDRFGHALALGIDVEKWYSQKNYRILVPQQEYLDNIVWLYHVLRAFRIPVENYILDQLKKEFEYYFKLIYRNTMLSREEEAFVENARIYYRGTQWEEHYANNTLNYTIENYYYFWCIRGDNPELYKQGFYKNKELFLATRYFQNYYAINRLFPVKQNLRYFPEVGILYYYYHYNWDIREKGLRPEEIKISNWYLKAVKAVQSVLQRKVAERGIGIETNPSSNCQIGTFKRYDQHPIIRFYNKNLVQNPEKVEECPQLNVSINTDDKGIFDVSLENEYAYMALALEEAKDKDGNCLYSKQMIYHWLDDVREMGVRQTFLTAKEIEDIRKKL